METGDVVLGTGGIFLQGKGNEGEVPVSQLPETRWRIWHTLPKG